MDDAGTGVLGGVVIKTNALPHEQHFAGEIHVVRARLRAGLHEGQAVVEIGPHRADDHPRGSRQRAQRFRIGGVRDDQAEPFRARMRGREVSARVLQLGPIAPGQRDAQILGSMACEVFRGERADEAGGPEQHNVVCGVVSGVVCGAVISHAPFLQL